jgi:hypothetical protein
MGEHAFLYREIRANFWNFATNDTQRPVILVPEAMRGSGGALAALPLPNRRKDKAFTGPFPRLLSLPK